MELTYDSCNDFLMYRNATPWDPHNTLYLLDSFHNHNVLYFSPLQRQIQDFCTL
jgi:hypothetical protein